MTSKSPARSTGLFFVWLLPIHWLNVNSTRNTPRGLSLRALAMYSGIGRSTLSAIVRRERRAPPATCQKLADYFGVDEDYLLRLNERHTLSEVLRRVFPDSSEAKIDYLVRVLQQAEHEWDSQDKPLARLNKN